MKNEDIPTDTVLWRVQDTAKFLGRTRQAIYKMVERGQIPYVKIGRSVSFNPSVIQKWLNSKTVKSLS